MHFSFLFLYFDETKLYNMTTAISIITLIIVFILWLVVNGLHRMLKDLNSKVDTIKFIIVNHNIKDPLPLNKNYENN